MLLIVGCGKSQSSSPAALNNQNIAAQQPSVSPSVQTATKPVTASNSRGRVDVCSLLTAEEVRSVQGEAFKETKASGSAENGLVISQCFFSLPTFANSVNLAVMQKGEGAGARDPREYWEQTFANSSERDGEKEREKRKEKSAARDREEEEKGSAPLKVEGVGEEAFWTGNRVGGALYVLKHDSYIRVSVGGAGDQKTKIEKSKALARLALKRLG
jgi:hypothetical protein